MSIDNIIATRLYQLRKANGLSIDALAQQSGVSKAMISKIERQESSPTAVTLGKLAAGLGVPLAQLLLAEEQPPQRLRKRERQESRCRRRRASTTRAGAASRISNGCGCWKGVCTSRTARKITRWQRAIACILASTSR